MTTPVLEPHVLTPLLEREYGLPPPITCELIRRGFNDHYRVTAGEQSAVFRIYLDGKYYISSAADFRFELELLDLLARRGVSVAHPIPRRDGSLLGTTDSETGGRASALFTTAAGAQVETVTPEQARALGETVGAFHVTANQLRSWHRRGGAASAPAGSARPVKARGQPRPMWGERCCHPTSADDLPALAAVAPAHRRGVG